MRPPPQLKLRKETDKRWGFPQKVTSGRNYFLIRLLPWDTPWDPWDPWIHLKPWNSMVSGENPFGRQPAVAWQGPFFFRNNMSLDFRDLFLWFPWFPDMKKTRKVIWRRVRQVSARNVWYGPIWWQKGFPWYTPPRWMVKVGPRGETIFLSVSTKLIFYPFLPIIYFSHFQYISKICL